MSRAAVLLVFLVIFVMFSGASGVWGYEEGPVVSPGILRGKVYLQGTPPPARIYHLVFSPNIDFCSKISDGKGNRLLKEFKTDAGGGLRDAVVALVGVQRGKPFDFTPEVKIEICRISPFVTPVRNRHPISIVNHDPISHDIQAYTLKGDYTFAMFNKPMIPESSALRMVRFRDGHYLFRTQCGVHDFMQSWGMAIGNPYFAVTGEDGSFTISDIPPGTYDVIAWHPHLQVQTRQVTLEPDGTVDVFFQFDSTEVNIPLHDLQTGYRLSTVLQPSHLELPLLELQRP